MAGRDPVLLKGHATTRQQLTVSTGDFRPSLLKYLIFQDQTSLDVYVKFLLFLKHCYSNRRFVVLRPSVSPSVGKLLPLHWSDSELL